MPDHIKPRLPASLWITAIGCAVFAYGLTFIVVHPYVDTRLCTTHLVDPFFAIIPKDTRWWVVTIDLYTIITIWMLFEMLAQAVSGDHRVPVRFALGLGITGLLRCATLMLVPLCRITVPVGTAPLAELPMVDLGFIEFPFRAFATNDLLFSGHIGEAVLFILCTKRWRKSARICLWIFMFVQIYGLWAARGHYTIDMLVAIPFAVFSDRVAVKLLEWGTGARRIV